MTHEQLKRLVNDCTYSEDGITYMSDEQFNNMSNYINELKRDNVKLKRVINELEKMLESPYNVDCISQNKAFLNRLQELKEGK